ncbi:MAG: ABC transporter permease [Desulfovibrionaceae bacterium]
MSGQRDATGRGGRMLRRMGSYVLVLAGLGALWKLAAATMGSAVLPDPGDAVAAFVLALGRADWWGHFAASSWRALAAMTLAWVLGFPLGICLGSMPRLDRALGPFVFLTYPIPKIVLLPVFLLVLGLGDAAKIGMITLILWYQVLVTTRDGVKLVNRKYFDSVRSLGGGRWALWREVLIPAALPHGFTALRLNTGVSVAVLFFVESFATTRGLGYLIMDAWGRLDYLEMFTGIFGMSILGAVLYEGSEGLERLACRWRFAQRG